MNNAKQPQIININSPVTPEGYPAFVKEWRAAYRYSSLMARDYKIAHKLGCSNLRKEKRENLEKQSKALATLLETVPPVIMVLPGENEKSVRYYHSGRPYLAQMMAFRAQAKGEYKAKYSTRYNLVAYRPDSAVSCRQVTLETYNADLQQEYNLTEDQLVEKIASIRTGERAIGEANHGLTVSYVRNQRLVVHEVDTNQDEDWRKHYNPMITTGIIPDHPRNEIIVKRINERIAQILEARRKELQAMKSEEKNDRLKKVGHMFPEEMAARTF